jgi:hypothetical protein
LAALIPASLVFADQPGLLWSTLADRENAIAQAQCINGACPYYAMPGPAPVVVDAGPDYEYVVEQPGCDVISPSCDMPMACDTGCAQNVCSSCCCCPLWTIRGEALFWGRSGGDGVPLVTAPVAVNSGDFDFGWEVGPRVTAIRHGALGTAWDLEVAYFGIDDWSDAIALADMDDYQTVPPIIIGGVTPGVLTYDSSLHSAEVNVRGAYNGWITWLAGFRWIEVGENLNATFGAASHNVNVDNTLYGGQLGLDALLWDNGANLFVTGVGKAGIYANDANQVTTTVGVGGALPLIVATGGETSFVGELGLNAKYRFTDRLTAIAGYNVLWITGVALAPNQLGSTNINTGVAAVNADGTLFYHGANAGLEYVW